MQLHELSYRILAHPLTLTSISWPGFLCCIRLPCLGLDKVDSDSLKSRTEFLALKSSQRCEASSGQVQRPSSPLEPDPSSPSVLSSPHSDVQEGLKQVFWDSGAGAWLQQDYWFCLGGFGRPGSGLWLIVRKASPILQHLFVLARNPKGVMDMCGRQSCDMLDSIILTLRT